MIELSIAKRYARALLDVAVRANAVQRIEEEIVGVGKLYGQERGLAHLLENPTVSREEKRQVLRALFEGKLSKEVMEFLDLLVDRRRCHLISEIGEMFDDLADEYEGVVLARVATAQPLSDQETTQIRERISRLEGGKKVDLEVTTDAGLLGGMTIRIRDNVFDASLAGKLKRLHEGLLFAQRTTT